MNLSIFLSFERISCEEDKMIKSMFLIYLNIFSLDLCVYAVKRLIFVSLKLGFVI